MSIHYKKNRLFLTVIMTLLLFTGCGGLHKEEIQGYYPSTSITSTNDLVFYKIYRDSSDSFFKIKKGEYYFCMNNKKDNIADQCLEAYRGKRLPSGTTIKLTGNIVKTENWGIYTFNTGPAPTTYFEGHLENDTIWIVDFELRNIIYNSRADMIDNTNKQAYEVFKNDLDKF